MKIYTVESFDGENFSAVFYFTDKAKAQIVLDKLNEIDPNGWATEVYEHETKDNTPLRQLLDYANMSSGEYNQKYKIKTATI